MSGWTSIASALRSPSWTPPVPAAQPQPGHDPATLIPVLGALVPGTPVAGAGRSRHRRGPDPVDWSRAGLAGQPRAAAHPPGDPPGLLWTAGRPLATPIPRLEREIDALAKPDPRSGPHGAARRWPVDGQDVGRRARRPRPLPDRPSGAPGPGCPSGAQLRPQARPWPHHQAGSPWVRPILQAAAPSQRQPMVAGASGDLARRPGNHIATTAITRRLLARSCHIRIQVWRQHRRRLVPGAFAFAHAPATRPLTGLHSPGPDFPSCGPRLRARMGAGEPTPTRRPGLLHHLVPPSATATGPPAGRSLHAPRQGPAP